MATHAPIPADLMLAAIPSLPRALLARLVDRLIDELDERDGDPDLEDDDPSGGSADDAGEAEEWRRDGIVLARPLYAVDQSAGPVNVGAADLEFSRAEQALWEREAAAYFRKGSRRHDRL